MSITTVDQRTVDYMCHLQTQPRLIFISSSVIGKGNEEARLSLLPMSHLLLSPDDLLRNVYTLLEAHKFFVGISAGIILANTVHSTCEIVNFRTQSNRSPERANSKILESQQVLHMF